MTNANASASAAARALLEEFWDKKLPIDPREVARKLGLEVVEADLGFLSGYLDKSKRTIFVNSSELPVRQRFTIAHELGHYCLEHGSSNRNTSIPNWFTKDDPSKERDANQFAADLLMPAIAVKALYDEMGIKDPRRLCELLGVSASALNIRLNNLGYFL